MRVKIVNPVPDVLPLDATEDGRPLWLLQEELRYYIDDAACSVPVGVVVDFASVPRGLWNTFPPYDPKYSAAAIIHDWLYMTERYPRKINDQIFLEAMIARGVKRWKRNVMHFAVRVGGGFTYKKHTVKSVMKWRAFVGVADEKRPLFDCV